MCRAHSRCVAIRLGAGAENWGSTKLARLFSSLLGLLNRLVRTNEFVPGVSRKLRKPSTPTPNSCGEINYCRLHLYLSISVRSLRLGGPPRSCHGSQPGYKAAGTPLKGSVRPESADRGWHAEPWMGSLDPSQVAASSVQAIGNSGEIRPSSFVADVWAMARGNPLGMREILLGPGRIDRSQREKSLIGTNGPV